MIKSRLSNLFLSRVNLTKIKGILGHTPFLKAFYKLGSQFLIDDTFPTHVYIETSRACNLACTCCPRELGPTQKGHMDMEIFKKIVDEATAHGVRNFCLHMLGEPLLHPDITEMTTYIKKSNPKHSILLTTNGYFLDERKANCFLENQVDKINVSLFSLRKDRNKALTGKGDISQIITNMERIAALKNKRPSKTQLYLRVIVSDDNKDEISKFRTLATSLGFTLELRVTHNYSGVIKNNYLSLHKKKRFQKRYPCYHLWFSPAITWDAKIVICCADWKYSEILGDIRHSTLANVWQGERVKQLREHHLRGEYDQIPVCAQCNVWSTYPDIFFDLQKKPTLTSTFTKNTS